MCPTMMTAVVVAIAAMLLTALTPHRARIGLLVVLWMSACISTTPTQSKRRGSVTAPPVESEEDRSRMEYLSAGEKETGYYEVTCECKEWSDCRFVRTLSPIKVCAGPGCDPERLCNRTNGNVRCGFVRSQAVRTCKPNPCPNTQGVGESDAPDLDRPQTA